MFWILAFPSLLALLVGVPLLPYGAAVAALRQGRRADGAWGGPRLRAELTRLAALGRRALLRPLLLLAVVQLPLALHHVALGPGHWLAEAFGDHHPEVALHAVDFEAWEEAYREWQAEDGQRREPVPVVRQLVAHWPLYPSYLALAFTFLGVHFFRTYPRAVRAYARGVRRRATRDLLFGPRGSPPPARS